MTAMCFMYGQLSNELQNSVKTIRPTKLEDGPVEPKEYARMLKTILLPAFTPELQLQRYLGMEQMPKQTIADFFNNLKDAYTGANLTEFTQFKAKFTRSIRSKKVKEAIVQRRPNTFEDLLAEALKAEQEVYSMYRAHPDKETKEAMDGCWSVLNQDHQLSNLLNRKPSQLPEVEPMDVDSMYAVGRQAGSSIQSIFGTELGDEQVEQDETDEDRGYWEDGELQAMDPQSGSSVRRCYHCHKPGHLKRQCPQRRNGSRGRGMSSGTRGAPRQYVNSRPSTGRGRSSAPPGRPWSKESISRTLAQITAQLENQDFHLGVNETNTQ